MDRKEISFSIGKRLRELRKEHGLSHADLAKRLSEKYDVSISRDSLMAYEISDENHSKAKNLPNLGMRVEYLYVLADFYGVSMDYLLGITDVKSRDCTVKEVCEYTGLFEENVKWLHELPDTVRGASYKILEALNILMLHQEPFEAALIFASNAINASLLCIEEFETEELTGTDYLNAEKIIFAANKIPIDAEDASLLYEQMACNMFGKVIRALCEAVKPQEGDQS